MQLKKLLQGSVFAAAAAVCVLAAPGVAQAADGDFGSDGSGATVTKVEKAEMTVTSTGKEVLVGIAKVNTKKGTATVANWSVYDGTSATVDLSKLSNVKDNYIAVKSEEKDIPSIVKIPAADKAISAQFVADTATLKVATAAKAADAKKAAAVVSKTGLFEYRTAYSAEWSDLYGTNAAVDLTKYQQEGATLYVRAKETAMISTPAAGKNKVKYNGTEIAIYDLTAKLPGKEAKVNIPARTKGPAVAADYTKGTITLPKNSEYRIVSTTIGDVTGNADKKPGVEIGTLLGTNASGWLEVHTKAVENKKAASKWTRIKLVKPTTLSTTEVTAKDEANTTTAKPETTTEGEKVTYGGEGVKGAEVKEGLANAATKIMNIDYKKSGKSYVVTFENNGARSYEVTVTDKKATEPTASAKTTKIPSKKKVTLKANDQQYIYIRVAGDKKTQTWVGSFTALGLVDYPKEFVGTLKKD